ncbi:MAG: SRPBCC family protein [Chloroflexales bacterium]|nr:SRPBCC family protein [Chloroflexales bacterium]
MTTFAPLRLTRSATIQLNAGPTSVFPLFTPLGERLWVPDWNPTIIYPASGDIDMDAVFTTRHGDDSLTVWTVVESVPEQFRVAYVRVAPASHVARISVQCTEAAPAGTRATVTYVFTGLTEQGNAYVAQFTEPYYEQWIQQWQASINAYLHGIGAA